MTQPTQAQIEAEVWAVLKTSTATGSFLAMKIAERIAALTAAAEVGEPDIMQQSADVAQMDAVDRLGVAIKRIAKLTKDRSEIEAATIEWCAQVAVTEEEASGDMPPELHLVPIEDAIRAAIRATKKSIARRIRALKDK